MQFFHIRDDNLDPIRTKIIELESGIQKLVEKNLKNILGLEFVSGLLNREFSVNNLRLDTLAFDPIKKSFVIIEYKRYKNSGVIDQALTYLYLLIKNKAEAILEYNQQKNKNLTIKDVNWDNTRIIIIADSFSKYQKIAVNYKDLPIELWEVKFFSNETMVLNKLKPHCLNKKIALSLKNI